MNCQFCDRTLREGDIIHAIKYGCLTSSGFEAASESAVVVVCDSCGNQICSIVYGSLDPDKIGYPGMFKIYEELTTVMKNGYKFIQAMAKLPQTELATLQRVIRSCTPHN